MSCIANRDANKFTVVQLLLRVYLVRPRGMRLIDPSCSVDWLDQGWRPRCLSATSLESRSGRLAGGVLPWPG